MIIIHSCTDFLFITVNPIITQKKILPLLQEQTTSSGREVEPDKQSDPV